MAATELKFSVPASTQHLEDVRRKLRECGERAGISEKVMNQIVLAADEAVTNVVIHAYGNDGISMVDIEVRIDKDRMVLIVRDSAPPFDPTGHPDPDLEAHLKEGRKSGLGIYLMKRVMDEVRHRVVDGNVNELILIKNLRGED